MLFHGCPFSPSSFNISLVSSSCRPSLHSTFDAKVGDYANNVIDVAADSAG